MAKRFGADRSSARDGRVFRNEALRVSAQRIRRRIGNGPVALRLDQAIDQIANAGEDLSR
jgi:hypothetical protein